MLNNLSEQIRECLNHAEDCARKAGACPDDSPFKQDFLNLEKRWLDLARSYGFGAKSAHKRRQYCGGLDHGETRSNADTRSGAER